MHRPPARRLPLPYLQIINPLEGFIGTEDQDRNKQICSNPSIRRKTFLKLSIPLARISGNRIIGSMASPFFFYLLTPLIFLHSLIFPNNLPSRETTFLRDYRWSSYPANGEGKVNRLISPQEEFLCLAKDPQARRQAYRA